MHGVVVVFVVVVQPGAPPGVAGPMAQPDDTTTPRVAYSAIVVTQ